MIVVPPCQIGACRRLMRKVGATRIGSGQLARPDQVTVPILTGRPAVSVVDIGRARTVAVLAAAIRIAVAIGVAALGIVPTRIVPTGVPTAHVAAVVAARLPVFVVLDPAIMDGPTLSIVAVAVAIGVVPVSAVTPAVAV